MIQEPLGKFELGFDRQQTRAENRVSGVKETSAAYEGGLRDGQTVLKLYPITLYDPVQTARFIISEGGKEREITFHPASREQMAVPQYRIKQGATARAACTG